jgi:hypothetical protein
MAAAIHTATVGTHCAGGKQASTKSKDQRRTHSLQQDRSCVGGDLIHSIPLYKYHIVLSIENFKWALDKISKPVSLQDRLSYIYLQPKFVAESA